MLILVTSLALAADPSVEVAWKNASSTLHVVAPAGEHVAEDAPVQIALQVGDRSWTLNGLGADLHDGVAFGEARGMPVSGSARLSLCLDGGTQCRFAEVAFAGAVPAEKKGRVVLGLATPQAATHEGPFQQDAAAAAEKAFALATTRGVPVLVDFAAVWCPPCDLLEAEVLYSADHADLIGRFVLLSVDADDPTSWAIKDRYQIGSYPTLVVARADGTEIDHMIGYAGVAATTSWLDTLADGEAQAAATTPEGAARRAWSLFELGREDDAREALKGATGAEDTVPYRLTRVVLDPTVADARWLAENAPSRGHDWLGYAKDLADEEAGKIVLAYAIQEALPLSEPAEAADLLSLMGTIEGEPLARTWYAAAAVSLKASFTGDPNLDRGHWLDYADLLASAGQVDAALAFLEDARGIYPGEPTWTLTAARLLLEADRPAEALEWLDRDMATAWGDNLVRMATRRVEALQMLGRRDEALAYGREVLASSPVPPEGTDVRTTRYRTRLEELLGDETAEAP